MSSEDLINFFLDKENCVFKKELLEKFKYFNPDYVENSQHFVAIINEEIVGIIAYKQSKVFFLNYVTVNPDFQNQKIGTLLIKALLNHIKEGTLVNSYYTEEGMKLIPTNQRLCKEYPLINWVHKINQEYQSVKCPALSIGDNIEFLYENEWKNGCAIGLYATEDYIIKIKVVTNNQEYVIEQNPDCIKLIK